MYQLPGHLKPDVRTWSFSPAEAA